MVVVGVGVVCIFIPAPPTLSNSSNSSSSLSSSLLSVGNMTSDSSLIIPHFSKISPCVGTKLPENFISISFNELNSNPGFRFFGTFTIHVVKAVELGKTPEKLRWISPLSINCTS